MHKPDKKLMYDQSKKRWQNAEASLTGIMAGFDRVSDIDIKDSCLILENLISTGQINPNRAIDCAAGIGRVSQYALTKYFNKIDILERDQKFIEYCQKNFAENPKIENIFCNSLEDFQFDNLYDTIWVQWCLQDLQEDDVISFLVRCKNNLTNNGVIIVKENIYIHTIIDEDYGNEIRSDNFLRDLFAKCGLVVLQETRIAGWPNDLLPIGVFVLR
ncbi:MAG: methyltransferase domain-containing protein [Rickettsiales bacterium]|nr:methyltransferase domain-containing protein [Rickettsiales bacterium]